VGFGWYKISVQAYKLFRRGLLQAWTPYTIMSSSADA